MERRAVIFLGGKTRVEVGFLTPPSALRMVRILATMLLVFVSVRRHITKVVFVVFLGTSAGVGVQTTRSTDSRAIYLIEATPAQNEMPQTYPAALYTVGEQQDVLAASEAAAAPCPTGYGPRSRAVLARHLYLRGSYLR